MDVVPLVTNQLDLTAGGRKIACKSNVFKKSPKFRPCQCAAEFLGRPTVVCPAAVANITKRKARVDFGTEMGCCGCPRNLVRGALFDSSFAVKCINEGE